MMNMMNQDPNKSFITVLLNKEGKAENRNAEPESESVDPDQGLIEAAKELVKAIEKKDAKRIVRCFKYMMRECQDYEMEDEND